jgi:hypothetical protein
VEAQLAALRRSTGRTWKGADFKGLAVLTLGGRCVGTDESLRAAVGAVAVVSLGSCQAPIAVPSRGWRGQGVGAWRFGFSKQAPAPVVAEQPPNALCFVCAFRALPVAPLPGFCAGSPSKNTTSDSGLGLGARDSGGRWRWWGCRGGGAQPTVDLAATLETQRSAYTSSRCGCRPLNTFLCLHESQQGSTPSRMYCPLAPRVSACCVI